MVDLKMTADSAVRQAAQDMQAARLAATARQEKQDEASVQPPQDMKQAAQQAAAVWEDAVKRAEDAYSAEADEAKSLAEMMKEAKERAEEQRERFKLPKNTRYGDMPMEAYARLSKARTQAQASAAAGYARRKILQCQAALRQDPDNAARIRATIQSLQKAVNRAGRKKRELQQDQLTEAQRAKAAQRREKQKALRLKRELCRRKTMRGIREHGYLRECEIENRLQDQLQQTRMELQQQLQQLNTSFGTTPEMAAQQYTAQAAAGTAPAADAAVDIQA